MSFSVAVEALGPLSVEAHSQGRSQRGTWVHAPRHRRSIFVTVPLMQSVLFCRFFVVCSITYKTSLYCLVYRWFVCFLFTFVSGFWGLPQTSTGALPLDPAGEFRPPDPCLSLLVYAPAHSFSAEIGRRATLCTADPRETTFLYQRISVAIQRFNDVCPLANTFTVSESPS